MVTIMTKQIRWSIKPRHKKNVIATVKGWVVEETGEVLVSVRGLVDKLKTDITGKSAENIKYEPLEVCDVTLPEIEDIISDLKKLTEVNSQEVIKNVDDGGLKINQLASEETINNQEIQNEIPQQKKRGRPKQNKG